MPALDIDQLTLAVGYAPGELPDNAKMTGDRRSAIRKLARKNYGVPSAITSGLYGHNAMTAQELRNFWNASERDRLDIAVHLSARFDPSLVPDHANTSKPAQDAAEPQPAQAPDLLDAARQARKVSQAANPSAADPSAQLGALIAQIAGASVNEQRVRELIEEYAPAPEAPTVDLEAIKRELRDELTVTVRVQDTTATRTVQGHAHRALAEVLTVAQISPVMLVGPAGSGKTHLAGQVAEGLGVGFHFNGALDSKYALTGFVDAQGRYQRTPFREAYEHGGVYLFDELDASNPAAVLAFNAALSNGHMDFPDGRVEQHAQFHCIAATNTYGNGADRLYVGRTQLDAASLDRFAVIDLDYDEDLERRLAGHDAWTANVQAWREAARTQRVRAVFSPRASIKGARLLAAGVSWERCEALLLRKGLDADTAERIKREADKATAHETRLAHKHKLAS